MNCSSPCDGAGAVVGVGAGDCVGLGVGVGFGVGVGLGDGVGAAVGAADAVAIAVGFGDGVDVGAGGSVGVGEAAGIGNDDVTGRERGKRYNTVHRSRKEDCRHPQHKREKIRLKASCPQRCFRAGCCSAGIAQQQSALPVPK